MDPSNRGSLQRIIVDEISLEGLEGVTLPSLWVYLGKTLNISLPLPESLQDQVWKFILRVPTHLELYELPTERSTVKLIDRYEYIDADLGVPLTPDRCPAVRYKVVPISDGPVIGSCECYKERKKISLDLVKDLSLVAVYKMWGNKFIIVASQELRYNALTPANVARPKELTTIQYCIWEAIGRARFNGETTSGTWSLTHFCKDSTIVFYIKNKLIRHGVVSHQLFNEKRGERLTVTTLLTLPRFYHTRRSTLLNMVEQLFVMLKGKPDYTMPLLEARSFFPSFERQKSLKKAMLTHLFRQIFETRSLPYYEVYKNAKSKNSSSSRSVTMVLLRYPEKSIDDLFEIMQSDHDKSEDNADEDFHNEKHSYVDMPLREEFYNCVSKYGSRGCSQTEIYRHIAINHLTLRQMVKQMVIDGLLGSYILDIGRQRVNIFRISHPTCWRFYPNIYLFPYFSFNLLEILAECVSGTLLRELVEKRILKNYELRLFYIKVTICNSCRVQLYRKEVPISANKDEDEEIMEYLSPEDTADGNECMSEEYDLQLQAFDIDKKLALYHLKKRYVAIEHTDSVNKQVKDSLDVLQNLQCSEVPNLCQEEIEYADIPQITARIKHYKYQCNASLPRQNRSQRIVDRKAFTVSKVNEKCILSVSALRKLLQEHEKEKGLKDEICQKSIRRMLHHMSETNIIVVYEIVLQFEENIRIYRYVTHPKIDIEHFILKREILKLKNNFFLILEEKRLRNLASLSFQNKKFKSTKKLKTHDLRTSKNAMIPLKTHKPPKFLISRYLHEFLFYIVVELNDRQTPFEITRELLQHWQLAEPSLRIPEYLEELPLEGVHIKAYSKDISWRTFIQPLPRYSDKPAGWVYFVDAVDRMPLSIFNKIFHIDKGADERLTTFLNHPIRQHYLMRHLPSDLQYKISRVQLQRVYISVLKLLNYMGLIQVSERLNIKDPLVMWIYLNSRARVLDTSNAEAGYDRINSNCEYNVITFELRSFDDIHNYWTTLQRICVYTKLGFRSRNPGNGERIKELIFLKAVDFDEAPHHDIGYQPGDGLGAAGLSTNLFAHTFRNWSWSMQSTKVLAVKNMRTGRTSGSGIGRSSNKIVRVIGRKRQQISTIKRAKAQSSVLNMRAKKTAPRDAIDRDALKNMRTLRVSWTKSEDEVLLMAKSVAMYVAAPIPSLGLLSMCKVCRDIIRHSLGIFNKTTNACGRRLQFLIRQKRHVPQVPSWLHILQTNEYIQSKYGDMFLQKLKKVYPTRSDFSDALLVHYALIICTLFKLVYNSQDLPAKSRFIVPDTIQDFQKRFTERLHVQTDDAIAYKNPETDSDIQIMVVLNVLHSSLCALRDKTLYNLQAFEIYKNFSEEVLHAAFTKARTDALAVTVKRQNFNLLANQLSGPAYVLSSKYRLKLLFLRIPYVVYDAFYEYFEKGLQVFFGQTAAGSDDSIRCLELKSPTLGQLFVIGEGLSRNIWDVNIKLPTNILTVDADQSQSVSSMDRILDHYQCIFDNAPQQEYTKTIENEAFEKQIRVKFHPANLSYKIHYSPFDLISKLPSRYLHFFCALDCMEQEIEINFSKLQYHDQEGHIVIECPFKCVLKSSDYVSEISRIVEEKQSVLSLLTEMAPQKLLNLATSGLSIKVFTSNLLTLVRMLESYWREKESVYERKDLGKIASNLKSSKSIDWSELCNDILKFNNSTEDDFDKIEEYEPTLNKEERVIRAQDVFVVNLPTIQLKMARSVMEDPEVIRYHDMDVPRKLLTTEMERDYVLQKILDESYWKYTENDLCAIRDEFKDVGFTDMEEKHLEQIHDYIERHKLGVSFIDLMQTHFYVPPTSKQPITCSIQPSLPSTMCTPTTSAQSSSMSPLFCHRPSQQTPYESRPSASTFANIHGSSTTNNLYEATGNAHQHRHIRKLSDLPEFNGQPEQWQMFAVAYIETTQAYNYTKLEHLTRLQKALKGEAKAKVEAYLIHPESVDQVMSTLEFHYGRPQITIRSQISKEEFPYERFLLKALHFLSSKYLIKRVGLAHFMYVHKNHIRSWVVHTFNLKRLDRENMGSSTAALKRTYKQSTQDHEEKFKFDEQQSLTKRLKANTSTEDDNDAESSLPSKRLSKQVKRYGSEQKEIISIYPKERDVIVMKPVPWIRLNGSINRRVLDRWLGSILCECVYRNGCSVQEICSRFPHMFPVDIMFLLEILCDIECIRLTQIQKQVVDIFANYENIIESPISFVYDPDNTYVHSRGDATMRLCQFVGTKKYSSEFI